MNILGLRPHIAQSLVGRIDHNLKKITNYVKYSERNKNGAVIENEMEKCYQGIPLCGAWIFQDPRDKEIVK